MSLDSHRTTSYYINADTVVVPPASPTCSSSIDEAEEAEVRDDPIRDAVMHLQSEETEFVMNGEEATDVTNTNVAEFLDEAPGTEWSIPHPVCTNLTDQQPQIELAKFLSRPVLIKTHVWAQTDSYTAGTPWYPWLEFFNSTPIKNKINNYGLINCTLKMKFIINASPFYSGAMAFTYNPLQVYAGENIIPTSSGDEIMPYSQRPKVWIFPQTSEGGELSLPFLYHKNWLDITVASDVENMGAITPVLFCPLVSATGVTGTSVVINVYAWAENVQLHAPTTKLALQASEFDYKPSQIASSVSKAAGNLSRIPLIGPYMKATSTVASGFSKFASALGFTNVPNMDTVDAVKLQPFPHNASCEVSVPVDRACVDPKNEVTLDPRTVGLDGQDELSIAYIAGRETFIGNAILSSTDAVDALTLVSRVTPAMIYKGSDPVINFTPMGYLSSMFRAWRGDIIFRFKFVCTRFHKGRVRITFDPINDISTIVPDYTTVFNEVVDIGAEQDVEVRIPYSQAVTFLKTNVISGNYNLSGSALSPDSYSNGLITMRVVNPLSGPQAITAIPVMVFVRAAENLEFAHPTNNIPLTTTYSPYTLQSKEVSYPLVPKQVVAGNAPTYGDPNKYHVHYGEAIVSLRPLIHRNELQYAIKSATVSASDNFHVLSFYSSRRLKYPGYDAFGIWSAQLQLATGTAPYNFIKCNLPQLISLLFVGQRGSITNTYNIESQAFTPRNVSLKRYDGAIATTSYSVADSGVGVNAFEYASKINKFVHEFNGGTALTDMTNQPSISMNFPYYSPYNFQFVNPLLANLGDPADGTDSDNVVLQIALEKVATTGNCCVNVWSQLGPDYNFFFFRNTPSLYSYSIPDGAT